MKWGYQKQDSPFSMVLTGQAMATDKKLIRIG